MKRHTIGGTLAEQVDDYNRRVQQEAFHIRIQDDGCYTGVLRFQLEHGQNRVVKAVRVQSDTTAAELTATLLEKFNVDTKAQTEGGLKVSLIQVTGDGELVLSGADCPLKSSLQLDVVPRFVLRVTADIPVSPTSSESPGTRARQGNSLAKWLLKKPFAVKLMSSELASHLSLRRRGDQHTTATTDSGNTTPHTVSAAATGVSATRSYSTVDRRLQHGIGGKKTRSMLASPLSEGGDIGKGIGDGDSNGASSPQQQQKLKPSRSLENLADMRVRGGERRPDGGATTDRRRQKVQRVKSIAAAQSMSNMLSIDSQEEQLCVHVDPVQFGRTDVDVSVDGGTTAEQIVLQVARHCMVSGDSAGDDDAAVAAFAEGHVLCDVVGRLQEGLWLTDYARPMADDEKPLMLLSLMKPSEGFSRRFELRPCATSAATSPSTALPTTKSRLLPSAGSATPIAKTGRQPISDAEATVAAGRTDGGKAVAQRPSTATSLGSGHNGGGGAAGGRGGGGGGASTDTMKFPRDRPYLLTVHTYDHENDSVLHSIDEGATVLGSADGELLPQTQQQRHVRLCAPDVLPQHCRLHWLTGYPPTVTIEPASEGAIVKVNGLPVSAGGIPLKPADLITLGKHYVFMFKDPTRKDSGRHSDQGQLGGKINGSLGSGMLPDALQLPGGRSLMNKSHSIESTVDKRNRLWYGLGCEDELISKVMEIISPSEDGFKLTPAYLFALAVEHSHDMYGEDVTQRLVLKISNALQGAVWDCVKSLSATTSNSSAKSNPYQAVDAIMPGMQPVLFWMANCSEIRSFFSIHLPKYFDKMATSDADELAVEICSAVEETVTYAFQQTVYHLTKAVYPHLEIILTSNPFGDSLPEGSSMKDIVRTLELLESTCQEMGLSRDITEQLLCYLYFFIGTCLFNTLVESGTDKHLCSWDVGVKLRKNLETLETWANEHGCENGVMYLDKIISIADLLSTSKQFLIQTQWSSLRELFPNLGAAQLKRVLDLYQLGLNRPPPECWLPTAEDAKRAAAGDRVAESFDNHPPLLLPSTTSVDLWNEVHDPSFYDYLDYINACFEFSDECERSDSFFDEACEQQLPDMEEDADLEEEEEEKEAEEEATNDDDAADAVAGLDSPKAVRHGSPLLARRGKQQQSSSRSSDLQLSSSSSGGGGGGGSAGKHPHGYNPLFKKRSDHHQRADSESSTSSSLDLSTQQDIGYQGASPYGCAAPSLGESGDVAWDRELITMEVLGGKKKKGRNGGGGGSGGCEQVQRGSTTGDLSAMQDVSRQHGARSSNGQRGTGHSSESSALGSVARQSSAADHGKNDQGGSRHEHQLARNDGTRQDGFDESEIDLLVEEDCTLPEPHKAALSAFLKGEMIPDLDDDLLVVELDKGQSGLGLGIVDGLYTQYCHTGIYVKQLIPQGPAQQDGQLKIGYRILAVNGHSLVSADFQSALKIMKEEGSHVRLLAVKSADDVAKKIGLPVRS